MPKKIIYTIVIIFLVGLILSSIIQFVNLDDYKTKIITEINNSSQEFIFDSKDKMHVSLLPWPNITLKNCTLKSKSSDSDDFILDNIDIKGEFSMWSMFTGKFNINKITFINGAINIELGSSLKNLLSSTNDAHKNLFAINTISFQNSNISVFKLRTPLIVLNDATATMFINNQNIFIKGQFSPPDLETISLDFKLQHQNDNTANINTSLTSPNIELSLIGILKNENEKWTVTGKSNANIKNLYSFSNKYLITYFPFARHINSSESLIINSNMLVSEQEISFKDLDIKSPSLEASGNISDIISHSSIIDINLTINKIDLDNLTHNSSLSQDSLAEQAEKQALYDLTQTSSNPSKENYFIIPKNLNILFYMDVNDIIYNNYHVNNSKINAELSNGTIELYSAVLKFNKDANIELNGTISSDGIRPTFSGLINAEGSTINPIIKFLGYKNEIIENNNLNFLLNTKLLATPKEINLFDLDATISDLALEGNIILRLHDRLHISTDLNINTLNLDKFGINNYITNLIKEIKQSNYNYLSNLQWLRLLKFEANLNLNIDNLSINKYLFQNVSTNLFLAPSMVKFENTSIKSSDLDMEGMLALDIRYLRPKLDITFTGSNYSDSFINKLLSSNDTEKGINSANNNASTKKWSNNIISLPLINTFDGNIILNIDNVSIKNLNLTKLNFEAKLANYILYIEKLSSYIFDGQFAATGLLSTQPMIFSMSYALNNAAIREVLDSLFNIKSVAGYISTNGNISTQGTSVAMMINQLNAEFMIAARQASFTGFDVNVLVNSTAGSNYNIEEFDSLLQSSLNGSTTFNTIDGTFTIQNGLMQAKALELTTNRTRGIFSGNIDLNSWLLNSISEFAFIPKSGAQPLSFTLNLTGNINDVNKEIKADIIKNYLKSSVNK